MNRIVATMDDLPELPFEKVLSYLNLEDRLKARAVSRRWYHKINRFRPKSLCYSAHSSDFVRRKKRWVSGTFAKNFISCTRFESFFDTFGQTILSSLKRLRFCDLDLSGRNETAFARTLNSFGQLEELDIIRVKLNQQDEFNLNLPMLTSLQLESVYGIQKLALEASRLQFVKILHCYKTELRLEIIHGESVEKLLIDELEYTDVKKLKNVQYLYIDYFSRLDPTFLSSLQQLKELHLNEPDDVSELFEQKQRSGRADLKIYLGGLLLNGQDDPAINVLSSDHLNGDWLVYLAKNRSRLADQIPFYREIHQRDIEIVGPGLEMDLLKRFTDLRKLIVNCPVRDIERFLNVLRNCENNIFKLTCHREQPQDLFDQLPEHCAVQWLSIKHPPSDLAFLFRLKHLIHLDVHWPIDSETVRRAFEELPVLSAFEFPYGHMTASIEIGQSKQFQVEVGIKKKSVSDVNAAIEFIFGKRQEKRKAEDLE